MRHAGWLLWAGLVACGAHPPNPQDTDTDTDTVADTDTVTDTDTTVACAEDQGPEDLSGSWTGTCVAGGYGYYTPNPETIEYPIELELTDVAGTLAGTARMYDAEGSLDHEAPLEGCRTGSAVELRWTSRPEWVLTLDGTVTGDALTADLVDPYAYVLPCTLAR